MIHSCVRRRSEAVILVIIHISILAMKIVRGKASCLLQVVRGKSPENDDTIGGSGDVESAVARILNGISIRPVTFDLHKNVSDLSGEKALKLESI